MVIASSEGFQSCQASSPPGPPSSSPDGPLFIAPWSMTSPSMHPELMMKANRSILTHIYQINPFLQTSAYWHIDGMREEEEGWGCESRQGGEGREGGVDKERA